MKKTVKIVLGILVGLIILAIVVPFLIPMETYKKLIIKQVEQRISGRLELESMRVKILPFPGFVLKGLKLSNTTGPFAGQPIVAAGKVAADVQLRPLLSKIIVASLELDSPQVYYRTARSGKTNVDDLLAKPEVGLGASDAGMEARNWDVGSETGSTKQEARSRKIMLHASCLMPHVSSFLTSTAWATEPAEGKVAKAPSPWQFMVGGLRIGDGFIEAAKEGEKPMLIKHLDISLKDFSPTKEKTESPFKLAAALFGQEAQNFKIAGKVGLRPKAQEASAIGWEIIIGDAPFKLDADIAYGKTPPAIKAHLWSTGFTLDQALAFDPSYKAMLPKDVVLDGPIAVDISLSGTSTTASLSAKLDATEAEVRYLDTLNKPKATALKLELDGDYLTTKVDLKKCLFTLGGTVAAASGSVGLDEAKTTDLRLSLNPIDAAGLAKMVPMLAQLEGVTGPKVEISAKGPITNTEALDVTGNVSADRVKYLDYEVQNILVSFGYKASTLDLKTLKGNLYDGKLAGSGTLGLGKAAAYQFNAAIENVDLGQVPATKSVIKGRGTLKINATAKGSDANEIKKNLAADGFIHVANAEIPSLNMGQKLFGSGAWKHLGAPGLGFSGAALDTLTKLDATVKDMDLKFKIENGVIHTPDISWQHPKYRAQISGSVSLDETLDYKGQFTLNPSTTNGLITNATARGFLVNKKGELVIPFKITGKLTDPKVTPDEEYLATQFANAAAKFAAREAKQAIQEKVLPKLGVQPKKAAEEGAKKLFQGIFGK